LLLMVEMIESERSQKKGVVITIARSSSGYANEMGTEAKIYLWQMISITESERSLQKEW